MADTQAFKDAALKVRNLAKTPSNDEFVMLYSLFKQATEGDCNKEKPGITDPIGQAKYEAWNSKKGMDRQEAAQKYIAAADTAVGKYGTK